MCPSYALVYARVSRKGEGVGGRERVMDGRQADAHIQAWTSRRTQKQTWTQR